MALLVSDYILANPEFINIDDPLIDVKRDVYKQSARHLLRDFKSELIAKRRPFETEEYREYREENRRLLTSDGLIDFEQMLIKSIKQTSTDYSKLNKFLKEDLASLPYNFMNTKIDLDTWIHKVLVPYSLLDSNAITVELPFNPNDKFIPPIASPSEGGIDPAINLPIKTKLFPFDRWKVFSDSENQIDILILIYPEEYIIEKDNKIYRLDYFYLADTVNWYLYIPIDVDKDGKPIYELRLWYPHEYDSLPYATLPGLNTLSIQNKYYQETYAKSYLEWADEFLVRFQDDQVVHTRYAYPREIVDGVACTDCNGSGNKFVMGFNKTEIKTVCKRCDGTGKIQSSSISGRFFRNKDMLGTDKKEPVAFVSPDVQILSHTTPNAMFFLEEGRKTLGLNTMSPARETAESKAIREQYKIDKLLNYNNSLVRWKQAHLNQKLSLFITGGITDKTRIILPLPLSIAVKGEDALKEEIKNSLPVDKFFTIKKYIQEKYNNDEKKQRIHILALLYAPFLGMEETEIVFRINQGSYDKNDLIRADKAVYAFEQLVDEPGFMDEEKDDLMLMKAEDIVSKFFKDYNNIS